MEHCVNDELQGLSGGIQRGRFKAALTAKQFWSVCLDMFVDITFTSNSYCILYLYILFIHKNTKIRFAKDACNRHAL